MKKWLIVFSILLLATSGAQAKDAVSDLARFGVDARSAPVAIVDKALSIDEATPIILEGATENAYETSIAVTDPTADRTITLPDASGVPMLSNAVPEGANAVWGTGNGFYFEGTTANSYETTVSAVDPTADNTITIPDAGGSVYLIRTAAVAKTATGDVATKECYSGLITNTGAGGAIVLTLPTPAIGMDCLFVLTAAQDVDVNAADGTQILTLTNATGDAISSAATIGNFVWLRAVSTTQWLPLASSGTWTDVN